jgi:hypothetical protein
MVKEPKQKQKPKVSGLFKLTFKPMVGNILGFIINSIFGLLSLSSAIYTLTIDSSDSVIQKLIGFVFAAIFGYIAYYSYSKWMEKRNAET